LNSCDFYVLLHNSANQPLAAKTLLCRLVPGHKLYQRLQNAPNAKQCY